MMEKGVKSSEKLGVKNSFYLIKLKTSWLKSQMEMDLLENV